MVDIMIAYLLWADDLILLSDTPQGLQCLIEGLEKFCRKWHMLVNLIKTKVCIFDNGRKVNLDIHQFYYNGKLIDIVSVYKYLGILFSNAKNMFKAARDYLASQAKKAIFSLRNYITNTVGTLTPKLTHIKRLITGRVVIYSTVRSKV